MPKDPAEVVTPILDGLLTPGEQLRGWCLATEQSTFSGHTTILGVTDQRLLLQAVDRKFRAKDDALSIRPDELARADAGGAGSDWRATCNGMTPAQTGSSRSSASSIGPPVRTFTDPSAIGSRRTNVLRSSASLAGRAIALRPFADRSTTASKARRFSASPSTCSAVP